MASGYSLTADLAVRDLCRGNVFQPLLQSFPEGLLVKDVAVWSWQELLEMAAGESTAQRFLLRKFWDTVIAPLTGAGLPARHAAHARDPGILSLSLRNGLAGEVVKGMAPAVYADRMVLNGMLGERLLTRLAEVAKMIADRAGAPPGGFTRVCIDASRNTLVNADMPALSAALLRVASALTLRRLPRVSPDARLYVSFKLNRLGDTSEPAKSEAYAALRSLLQEPALAAVNIAINALASIDHAAFIRGLPDEELGKLIWVQQEWLEGGAWKVLLSDAAAAGGASVGGGGPPSAGSSSAAAPAVDRRAQLVREAHDAFFRDAPEEVVD
jgi:hypothetical protein